MCTNGFSTTDPLPHIIHVYHITYPQTTVHAAERFLTIPPRLMCIDVYIVRVNTLLLGGTPGQVYQGPDQEIGPASVRVAHVLACPVPCTSNMTTRFTQEVKSDWFRYTKNWGQAVKVYPYNWLTHELCVYILRLKRHNILYVAKTFCLW